MATVIRWGISKARSRIWALLVVTNVLLFPFPAHAAEYVIHISVDGLNSSMLQSAVDAGNVATFKRLQDEGAWTTNARADYTITRTLPNHTTMITGRPVHQVEGMPETIHHGYDQNSTPATTVTLHNAGNPALDYIASVFDVVHDAGFSTALYAAKVKFKLFDQSYNAANGAPHPNGKDKIDRFFAYDLKSPPYSRTSHVTFLTEMMAEHFRYTFIHYADLDDAGHTFGWGSPEWNASLQDVDSYLSDVLALIESDATLNGKTTLILTADHGGSSAGHASATAPANYTIPFFAWGAGVLPSDLYSLNAESRSNPGSTRPNYTAPVQPIRNGDSGNLALKLLGLEPIPGSIINVAQDLRIAIEGDFNNDGVVDAADYTAWRNHLGDPTEQDINFHGDGRGGVDAVDYDKWKQHYADSLDTSGGGGVPSLHANVPEPTALLLSAIATLVALSVQPRRQAP